MVYVVSRGAKSFEFASLSEVTRAIQVGRVDGGDLITDSSGIVQAIMHHPVLQNELIDDEVLILDRDEEMQVDLTPMIDVTFLLLIFFMATTMIVMFKAMNAPSSKGKKGPARRQVPTRDQVKEKYLLTIVREDGSISINDKIAVGVDAMKKLFADAMKKQNKYQIVLESNAKVSHGDMVRILDAAQLAKADKILFAKKQSQ